MGKGSEWKYVYGRNIYLFINEYVYIWIHIHIYIDLGDFSRDIRSLLVLHFKSLDMSRMQRIALTLMSRLRLFSGEANFNEEGAEGIYIYIDINICI
jgi:hypothetical protein